MNIIETPLKDCVVVEPAVFGDDRGWFMEAFNAEKLEGTSIPTHFVQDNHSKSQQGVLRGLHFQHPPKAQGKLVRCVRGTLWDVAVDLRKDSPTYKQWFGIELSEENKKMLYVPVGFGHGFYSVTDCEMLYKCTDSYSPEHDAGVMWNDPEIGIEWPSFADAPNGEPVLSEKDLALKPLSQTENPF